MERSARKQKDDILRSSFLNNASRYLLHSSPSSSSHFMHQKLALSDDQQLSKTLPVCQACGAIQIPGMTSRKSTRSKRTVQAKSGSRDTKSRSGVTLETELLDECLSCHRVTKIGVPSKQLTRIKKRSTTVSIAAVETRQPAIQSESTPMMSSSNRKRKKHKGLLANAKEQEERSKAVSGLDLMDFMKAV